MYDYIDYLIFSIVCTLTSRAFVFRFEALTQRFLGWFYVVCICIYIYYIV